MTRIPVIGLISLLTVSNAADADQLFCSRIAAQQFPTNGLFTLYYQTSDNPHWVAANNLISGAATPLTYGTVAFALVVHPTSPENRSGVVNIRLRMEAVGNQPDASDVNMQRDAISEPCGAGGRYYRLRGFAHSISTKIYEAYHDTNGPPVENAYLDRFHFYYKPDQANCVSTKDATRKSWFRFSSIPGQSPTDTYTTDVARPVNPPELNTPVAYISQGIATAFAAFGGHDNKKKDKTSPPGSPTATHYTKLISLLKKYDSRSTGEDCINFKLTPNPNEVNAYVSITDFDVSAYDSGYNTFNTRNWKIVWQTEQRSP